MLFVFQPAMAIIRVTASVTYTTSHFWEECPRGGTNGVVRKPLMAHIESQRPSQWYSGARYLASLLSCTLPDPFKGLCPCHLIHNASPTPVGDASEFMTSPGTSSQSPLAKRVTLG
jgi:hypothetical protein